MGYNLNLNPEYIWGYLSAFTCALIWSAYSLLSRKYDEAPTEMIGGFCGVTAVLSLFCHLLFEKTVYPESAQWVAVLALGVGPVGLAFFAWDYGVKKGNIKTLGSFSYFAPLLSTLLLIVFGFAEASWLIGISCILIIGGAILASGDFFQSKKKGKKESSLGATGQGRDI